MAPRPCTICTSPRRAQIEEAVAAYTSYRRISESYDVSIAAISRHIRTHVAAELLEMLHARAQRERESNMAEVFGPALVEFLREQAKIEAEMTETLGAEMTKTLALNTEGEYE